MTRAPIRIVPQEEIAGGLKEPPAFRLPDAKCVFADRAARFEALAAAGKGEPEYMRLMARLARAQQHALDSHPTPPTPDSQHLERCRLHVLPPLGTDAALDASWRGALKSISQSLLKDAPEAARRVLIGLEKLDAATLDTQAARLLSLDYPALDPATSVGPEQLGTTTGTTEEDV